MSNHFEASTLQQQPESHANETISVIALPSFLSLYRYMNFWAFLPISSCVLVSTQIFISCYCAQAVRRTSDPNCLAQIMTGYLCQSQLHEARIMIARWTLSSPPPIRITHDANQYSEEYEPHNMINKSALVYFGYGVIIRQTCNSLAHREVNEGCRVEQWTAK